MGQTLLFLALILCGLGGSLRGQNIGEGTSVRSEKPPGLLIRRYPAKNVRPLFGADFQHPQRLLEASGVTFPPGSFARWEQASARLVVRDTRDNLDLVDALLQESARKIIDPTRWFDASRVRTPAEVAGDFVHSNGYLDLRLTLATDGRFRFSMQGHIEPEATVYQGTWRFHNGWVILDSARSSSDEKIPFRCFYALSRELGGKLAIPSGYSEANGKKPQFLGYLLRVAPTVSSPS